MPDISVTITGAAIIGDAGTPDVQIGLAPNTRKLGPHGLVVAGYGAASIDAIASPIGAASIAEAGNPSLFADSVFNRQLGPLGLANKARNFSPRGTPDAFVQITGAYIELQAAFPDSSNAFIYVDGDDSPLGAGLVADNTAFMATASIGVDAGTVIVDISSPEVVSGAEITLGSGEVTAILGTGGAVSGGIVAGEAGTVSVNLGWSQNIIGAHALASASQPGVDTDSPVSVTVAGAESNALAGVVVGDAGFSLVVNLIGAEIVSGYGVVTVTAEIGTIRDPSVLLLGVTYDVVRLPNGPEVI